MISESFGHNDALPPQPLSGDAASAGAPGYPPAGQQERLAAIRAQEAAAQPENADAQLEGELASLDAEHETPTERSARLGAFLNEYFEGTFPPESKNLAVGECELFEND